MKLARLLAAAFSLSLRRSVAHRVNLAFDLGQSLIGIGAILATTLAVYGQTDSLAGWSVAQVLVLTGLYAIVSGLRAAFIDPSLTTLVQSIRDGTLDESLLRPMPSWFAATCKDHAPLALGESILGIGILVVGLRGLPNAPPVANVVATVVLTACALAIAWALELTVACVAFWAERFELGPLMASLWTIGRYPLDTYQQPLRTVVGYVVPVAGMITLPAETLTRSGWIVPVTSGLALAAGFVLLALLLFRRGLGRYTGATS